MANAGAFKKGEKRPNQGRPKGKLNKLTLTVKEAFEAAFRKLQNEPGAKLDDWAKENPTDFYKIAAKLIPTAVEAEMSGEVKHTITEIRRSIVRPGSSNR